MAGSLTTGWSTSIRFSVVLDGSARSGPTRRKEAAGRVAVARTEVTAVVEGSGGRRGRRLATPAGEHPSLEQLMVRKPVRESFSRGVV